MKRSHLKPHATVEKNCKIPLEAETCVVSHWALINPLVIFGISHCGIQPIPMGFLPYCNISSATQCPNLYLRWRRCAVV